jgi:hypothetical protein
LGRHPAGGFVSELPEPLNVSRPAQRGVGAEDFAPPETLKVRWSFHPVRSLDSGFFW